eukprot:1790277-Rhodomonas_salina.1
MPRQFESGARNREIEADQTGHTQAHPPKSNTKTRIPGSTCPENAVSCLGFRGGGILVGAARRLRS